LPYAQVWERDDAGPGGDDADVERVYSWISGELTRI
jgi:hypothetical protein